MISKKLTIEWLAGNTKLLNECKSIHIATALITDWALDILLRNVKPDTEIKILLGIHLPSSSKALETLLEMHIKGRLECRLYTHGFFHPKLYLLKTNTSQVTFVGSGNFTGGGLKDNIELFHKSDDASEYVDYKKWFHEQFTSSKPISKEIIDLLKLNFENRLRQQKDDSEELSLISDMIEDRFNLNAINFDNQFFTRANHQTFAPENRRKENDPAVDTLRSDTRMRFYDLHTILWPQLVSKGWNLNHHYLFDDIVSKVEFNLYRESELGAMWLHYGRGRTAIKRYGENETPLFFARLQVIMHYDDLGIWLRFGKAGGSRQDREYFHEHMKTLNYRREILYLLKGLGDGYWLRIDPLPNKNISDLKDEDELWALTQHDDWRNEYFIIGKSFNPGDSLFSNKKIVSTIIAEFEKLYPLYEKMRDKTFG